MGGGVLAGPGETSPARRARVQRAEREGWLPGPPWLPARRGCLARRTFEPAWPGRSHNPNHGGCATLCLLYALHAAQHHNQVRSARQVIATDRLQWLRVQEVVIARVVATGSAVRAASAAQSTTTVELALARRFGGLLRSGHRHGT